MNNKPTLVSMDVSRRLKEKEDLRQNQQREMHFKQVQKNQNDWNQSVSAHNDPYMNDALKKVREKSHITHNETTTRLNGTWFYNQSLNKH